MTQESYEKITGPLRRHPKLARGIEIVNRGITYGMSALYFGLILYYIVNRDARLFGTLVVPLDTFIVLSVVRAMINRPRPYERFGLPPVIPKKTHGKSMPSRHVFSAVIIGMTYLLWSPWAWVGVVILVIGALLMVVRVLSGVHFVSDVMVGMACGVVAGLLGYLVIL